MRPSSGIRTGARRGRLFLELSYHGSPVALTLHWSVITICPPTGKVGIVTPAPVRVAIGTVGEGQTAPPLPVQSTTLTEFVQSIPVI